MPDPQPPTPQVFEQFVSRILRVSKRELDERVKAEKGKPKRKKARG